jgi:PIN domain nuclease of toxin-antitoxin system
MSVILDASAMLALLLEEPGAEIVLPLAKGSRLLSVNFCEVIQRVVAMGGAAALAEQAVDRLEIAVVPFDRSLARKAAGLREPTKFMGASLADRACLALGLASGLPVLSGDRAWLKLELGIDIRMIR